ncbi:hypothetical protein BDP27DRAFT_1422189 [Rhodocollybia butyracea]|uniref:Uncharacterized protein n=1 Tax=Rhodocollybia butyracea TaxID=206335 RepID=A0A9P5PUC9_9AGAR|nr:hypothetical protein BDP27DRAFT_1422189 [Rhodocollybia butyracea]
MSISSNSFLSLPSSLDTLVLSTSSSSISSSTSSLFGRDGRLSNSSQTDTSPPISPLKEDEDDKCQSSKAERSWKRISETPKSNVLGFLSLVSHQDQGSSKAEYPYAAADEAGYEAEASDSDCYFAAGDRKKKPTKKALSSLARSNYCIEYSMSESEDDFECIVFSPSSIFERRVIEDKLPPKPDLRAQIVDLNSPSPIVALPSPRIKDYRQYASLNAFSFSQLSSSPVSLSTKHLTERFHIRETTLCNSPQKPLGLGLHIPASHSPTKSPTSPRILSAPAKKTSLPGLGIRLPSAPMPRPSVSEFRDKRRSLSGLGRGFPSTFHVPSTLVPSSEVTVRLVTPRASSDDIRQQVPLGVDSIPRQRRASMSITLPKGSSFPKRQLHPILESPPYSSSTTSHEPYHTLPKLKEIRSSRLENAFSPNLTGVPGSCELSPRSPSLKRSPLMDKCISPTPVYHDLGEAWRPVGVDQYLPMSTLGTKTLF